jgi:hypothetical protein
MNAGRAIWKLAVLVSLQAASSGCNAMLGIEELSGPQDAGAGDGSLDVGADSTVFDTGPVDANKPLDTGNADTGAGDSYDGSAVDSGSKDASTACDPLNVSSCGTGLECTITMADFMCEPATIPSGVCARSCAPGLFCSAPSGTETCYQICDCGGGTTGCTGSLGCVWGKNLGLSGTWIYGGKHVGLCMPQTAKCN